MAVCGVPSNSQGAQKDLFLLVRCLQQHEGLRDELVDTIVPQLACEEGRGRIPLGVVCFAKALFGDDGRALIQAQDDEATGAVGASQPVQVVVVLLLLIIVVVVVVVLHVPCATCDEEQQEKGQEDSSHSCFVF